MFLVSNQSPESKAKAGAWLAFAGWLLVLCVYKYGTGTLAPAEQQGQFEKADKGESGVCLLLTPRCIDGLCSSCLCGTSFYFFSFFNSSFSTLVICTKDAFK